MGHPPDRYSLSHEAQEGAEYRDLLLTIAIHEEVQRRAKGGQLQAKQPSPRELAVKIVTKGYQILSKDHHPDRGGSEPVQKNLNAVRAQLLEACQNIQDGLGEDDLVIPPPVESPISDEDIPF
jgi:hypothetical protein